MTRLPVARIAGQDCFLLTTSLVELAVTVTGGHLAPVNFFPGTPHPIRPYAIAPWAEGPVPEGTPPVIATLRGDFFCSAFGANEEPVRGQQLPLHGETANCRWDGLARGETKAAVWLKVGMDLPLQGGRSEATTALIPEHSVIYQRHDFLGLRGAINPGHHATLALPDMEGCARLSLGAWKFAHTYVAPVETAATRGASALAPNVEINDLRRVRCADGSTTDLTYYPARRGFDDIAIVCADPTLPFAWSAITVPEERYVWFSLRNPRQLASTLLWFSNGGKHSPPWNGRHLNVIGIEDVTAFFHVGLAASCRANLISDHGVRTSLDPASDGQLSISYIQGVARTPPGFDRVANIQAGEASDILVLRAESGAVADTKCHLGFLCTGRLPDAEF